MGTFNARPTLRPEYIKARNEWRAACASGDSLDIAVAAIMVARAAKLAQSVLFGSAVNTGSVR